MDSEQESNFDNKLINETSPYLLQHAKNPVYWYPFGDEAIEKARKQDKPILLSIGYPSCHWCHVMMRESFCDLEIAAAMNRLFVNIKVDKEERPDIDKVYQITFQLLMAQVGGWPLTLFINPHTLIPYYGGTYFPKTIEGKAGFKDLLPKLNEIYYHDRERIHQQETQISALLQIMTQSRPSFVAPNSANLIHKAEIALANEFDPAHGGFGVDTKFPNCPCIDFVLQSTDTMTRHMGLTTLMSMSEGGIYDQLGGGFFRYTINNDWQIPHFEKMLYDNGQLIGIYAKAYQITKKEEFAKIASETTYWLANNLLDKDINGFYTAFDADTEEKEGLYYLWDLDNIKDSLSSDEFASIKKYYHLNQKANFDKKWHLYIDPKEQAPSKELLAKIKEKLLEIRKNRVPPAIDNMILTSSNGLTIKGLSLAAQILENEDFNTYADNAIIFIRDKLYVDGQLYATWQNGKPKISGFLDDYAFVLDGILTFINNDANHRYLEFCQLLADDLIENFYDDDLGGFFFTSKNAEHIIFRPKTYTDDSIPSGNGTACLALINLGLLCNKPHYISMARKVINSALTYLYEAPELHLSMCLAYQKMQSLEN